MRSAALFVTLALCSARVQADSIDDYVRAEMARQKIPGVAVAIVKSGKPVKARGYGLSNIELKVPVTKDSVFMSGSVGKQFTSAAVMLLLQDGKLSLEDKISKYLQETPDTWKDITLRHLLTHTSGIKDYDPGHKIDFTQDASDSEMLLKFESLPLDFPPGDHWSYSNVGYILLGQIIKKASGKFYGDFLKERIFEPLGMHSTRVQSNTQLVFNRVAGYEPTKDGFQNQGYVSQSWNQTADGSLLFTASDLVKWDIALRKPGIFTQSTLDLMQRPVKLNDGTTYPYGFGWAVGDYHGKPLIEHGGAWLGFRTQISRYVEDKLSVIVLANSGSADPTRIAHGIAGRYLPNLLIAAIQPETDPDPASTETHKSLLMAYSKGETTAEMARGLASWKPLTGRERGQRAGLIARLNAMKSFEFVTSDALHHTLEVRGEEVKSIRYYRTNSEQATTLIKFYLTETGKVAYITTVPE